MKILVWTFGGSNATPIGGGAGRIAGAVDAVDAQKAEGVLHLHLLLYPQMVNQFSAMQEMADKVGDDVLSAEAGKEYVSHVRVASYPDRMKAECDEGGVLRKLGLRTRRIGRSPG